MIVTVSADDAGITLLVAPLRANGAEGLLAAAELPGVGNVLQRVADEVGTKTSDEDGSDELRIRLAFHT